MMEKIRTSVWYRIALPASVILNCFLIAWIAGQAWRAHEAPPGRILANIERNLDERDAAAFRSVMQREGPRLTASAQQVAVARRELKAQLMADPYDKEAARKALVAWRTSGNQFLSDFGDTLIEALAHVSPEGRRKVVANRAGQ
jgi:uncharacterized membrane protein